MSIAQQSTARRVPKSLSLLFSGGMLSKQSVAYTMQTAEASTVEISDYEKERGKPMPSLNHGIVQTALIGAFLSSKEHSVVSELTLELPDGHRLTPDISVYPRLRPDYNHDKIRMTVMPRLVVEIISPGQGWQDIVDKLDLYFAHGVESAWLVQPGAKMIAIYQSTAVPPQVITSGEAKDPVTGLTARLEEIFA